MGWLMDNYATISLQDLTLERAAEQLGDITPHVLSNYYRHHPDARQRFIALSMGPHAQLEGRMVEGVLYCLMHWYLSPGEIRIMLTEALLHHLTTLEISSSQFGGLITAVCDTVAATIPAEELGERDAWSMLHQEMLALVTAHQA